jgi:hypothetical protein
MKSIEKVTAGGTRLTWGFRWGAAVLVEAMSGRVREAKRSEQRERERENNKGKVILNL